MHQRDFARFAFDGIAKYQWCDTSPARDGGGAIRSRRSVEVRNQRLRVMPKDLEQLREAGAIAPSLAPYAKDCEYETSDLVTSLGGEESLSAQELMLVQDLARVGLVLRAELARVVGRWSAERGVPLVLVSHDEADAEVLAEERWHLSDGELVRE